MKNRTLLLGAITLLFASVAYSAHHEEAVEHGIFHEAFLDNLEKTNEKVVDLAAAFSEEQYEWSPADGIRSVRESILHVASANYFIGSKLGGTIPEGVNPGELESSIKGKEATIATLKASIKFAAEAIAHVSEDDLGTQIKMFGERSKLSAVLIVGAHANEHLGQLIAYARSVGVVPPWSK